VIQWDKENEMLVDYMGLPLPKSEVRDILEQAQKHLDQKPATLYGVYAERMHRLHPEQAFETSVKDFE
jgi:hypothetical protein